MKSNTYEIQKNVEKIYRGESTGFLLGNIRRQVESKLRRGTYQVFCPFEEADKVVLFGSKSPNVRLFRIDSWEDIQHSSILGSLFGLNIRQDMFGDIVFYEGNFYVYLLGEISELVVNELNFIGNAKVSLVEVPVDYLADYQRNYEDMEIIVSSLRLDTVIAKLVGCNRKLAQDKIRDKLVLLNYEEDIRCDVLLSKGDVFSIRKLGKYLFNGIVGRTKKDNYIVSIKKYL